MGDADGSIMATIISAHIRKSGMRAAGDHWDISGPAIFMPAMQHAPVKLIARAS